jgi:hypothetical protein
MAGERPDGPKVVDMPDTPGRPTLPGKPGAPDDGGNKPGGPGDGRELPGPTPTPPPGDGRDPIVRPPAPNPPGTPPGRPVLPGKEGPGPIDIDGRRPPEKENPDQKGNFDKGQVRDTLFPNGTWNPTDPGGLGRFNPFNTGFGPRGGAGGAGGGIPGTRGGVRGTASTYDPVGVGQSNYGLSRPIGNRGEADGSSENVYGMTGVNAATGYRGPAHFGVVGGQGGYGSGMVAPEYTGPQFDSAKDVLKAYRQQRRRGERTQIAAPVGKPIGGGTGGSGSGGGGTVGGPGGWNGKPGSPGGWGNGGGAAGQDPSSGKPGAPPDPAAAGGAAGGAAGQPSASSGKPGAPAPAPTGGATPGATPPAGASQALGAGQQYTDQFGNVISKEAYDQRLNAFKQGGLSSLVSPDMFQTQFGMLTRDSGGNSNVFKKNGASDDMRYHWDPQNGWRTMTLDKYRSYGDYNYQDPTSSVENARKAGAMSGDNRW